MHERINVIQEIINRKESKSYLEIGVADGYCFLRIKALRKIGVDPHFIISTKTKIIRFIINPTNLYNKYYEITSDEFFKMKPAILIKYGFDVVFIDGSHTYKQSLRDVLNSLKYLKNNGIIILHDCNPPSEVKATPAKSFEHFKSLNLPGWDKNWCGDVWKTIIHLRSNPYNLNIFVLDCDYGLGIITSNGKTKSLNYSKDQIEKLKYEDLERNRKRLLNLKDPKYFRDFINSI